MEDFVEGVKWLFVLLNVFLGLLFYVKAQQQKKFEGMMEEHRQNVNKNKVCLIIAHPDDEAMFFVPTIKSLISAGRKLSILCLSNGNYDGLGKIREKELQASAKVLGITQVHQIDREELLDGPDQAWSPSLIASIVSQYERKYQYGTLITFDQNGVSGHPNHISIYYGIKELYQQAQEDWKNENQDALPKFQVLTLDTTNIFRKYIGPVDAIYSLLAPESYFSTPWTSYLAMKAHHSQFVWFRRLFVIFSRYGYINTLQPITTQ